MAVLDGFFFYAFAALTLGGAIAAITRRSPVHAALALIVSLMGVAGLYLLQHAEFLFVTQIILYIGGVMVLFLFVIMLVNLEEASKQRGWSGQWWIALAAVAGLAAELAWAFRSHKSTWTAPAFMAHDDGGNTEKIADALFSVHLLPFEIASVLLLVAVVGSVYMARNKEP